MTTAFAAAASEYRGVVLGLYSRDQAYDYSESLDEIAGIHADTVLCLVTLHQTSITSATVDPLDAMQSRTLARTLALARSRTLRTAVIPIVALDDIGPGRWRGTLAPPSWEAWFRSYRQALGGIADASEAGGADFLAVGSELCSSETLDSEWRQVLAEARARFHGKLTYSANWDHLPYQPWIDGLDLLGLNAYYEVVCDGQRASADVIGESWRLVRNDIVAPWQRRFGKPMVFLEVGYPSTPGADRTPWNYTLAAGVDEEVQELLYLGFLRAWQREPLLAGVFFYVWWEGDGRDATGYTPRGKRAGELVRTFYAVP